MSPWPYHPTILEINAWTWLHGLGVDALDQVPDAALDTLGDLDAVWLMGVWERSPRGRAIAREHAGLRDEYRRVLPDLRNADVVGSPYAIHAYRVDPALGGDDALARLRERLARRGLRLILDFVPNHLAVDHPWVRTHPERLVRGEPRDLEAHAGDWFSIEGQVFAHGRDPWFPGWSDTVQIDYRVPAAREAMAALLADLATRCDGLRCDMAMLVTAEVFGRTWGGPPADEFWPAAIARARAANPDLLMMAEVYWDMEPALCAMGFDRVYDKTLYDRLVKRDAAGVTAHLWRWPDLQGRLVRFIENHDEPRAMSTLGANLDRAAATLALTLPGARLLHEGQAQGARVKLPVQLGRRPHEPVDAELLAFYRRLLTVLREPAFGLGEWHPLSPVGDGLIAHRWLWGDERWLVVANLSERAACGTIPLDLPGLRGRRWVIEDALGPTRLERDGDALDAEGLAVELAPGAGHVFTLTVSRSG